ncbi:MAG: PilW family protein [Moraxellaceae bacterium]|nr:PilW family protein [Moraxellaceae bacterium]
MKHFNIHTEQGFTLIELMISITLGLLVIAIAAQIYLTSYSTNAIQKGSSELTEGSVFGIQQVESHIRLANLGNEVTNINNTTRNGGIVLSANNTPSINTDYVTSGGSLSDRLTIQFRNITGKNIFDCEGNTIASGDTVIESYFLANGDLQCDASQNGVAGLTGNGDTVIKDVDAFGIRLGVQNATGTAYMTTADYLGLTTDKPAITSIKMGLLLHGSQPVTDMTDTMKNNFQLLGQKITVGTTPNIEGKFVRSVYESTTYLRNARFN